MLEAHMRMGPEVTWTLLTPRSTSTLAASAAWPQRKTGGRMANSAL